MRLLCWSLPSNLKVNLRSYIPEKFLNISFTRSQKGRPILLYAGKKFRREQGFNDGREYWRCMTDKCNARMTLQFGRIKKMKAEHKCDALNKKSKPKYTERLWEVGENYCRTRKEQEKYNKIEFVKMWTSVVVLDDIYWNKISHDWQWNHNPLSFLLLSRYGFHLQPKRQTIDCDRQLLVSQESRCLLAVHSLHEIQVQEPSDFATKPGSDCRREALAWTGTRENQLGTKSEINRRPQTGKRKNPTDQTSATIRRRGGTGTLINEKFNFKCQACIPK